MEFSREATSASRRSPATTSSISRTERSCPIASGVIDCGNTTVSFSGSTGSAAGYSSGDSSGSGPSRLKSVNSLHRDPVAALVRLRDDRKLDRQHAALEARVRLLGVDVLGQPNLTLERPVLDLHLLVDAARDLGPAPLA